MAHFVISEEQEGIVDAFRRVAEKEFPVSRLISREAGCMNRDAEKWPLMAELGWFALLLPEDASGPGLSLVDQCLIHRELGRNLLTPVVLSSMLGALVASQAGVTGLARDIAEGRIRVAPGLERPRLADDHPDTRESYVIGFEECEAVLVWSADEASLYLRDQFTSASPCEATEDLLALHRASFSTAKPAAKIASPAIERQATLLISAQLVGAAQAALDMAVEHATNRVQFGKPIGSFQAIKHKCADMLARVEVAWGQIMMAAIHHTPFHCSSAKVLAADAAIKNSAASVQIHGGMGFTSESAAHLYVKRAHTLDLLGGVNRGHHARIIASEAPV